MSAQEVIAAHRPDGPGCTGCGWHVHPLVADQLESLHAEHIVDELRAAGLAVVNAAEHSTSTPRRVRVVADKELLCKAVTEPDAGGAR